MSDIPHRKEVFEVQVICDRIEHPHHKGKPKHVTAFGYRAFDVGDRGGRWGVSGREILKKHTKPDTAKEDPSIGLKETASPEIEKVSGWKELGRVRYQMECPRCGAKAVSVDSSLTYVLGKLMEHGVTRISLEKLDPLLHKGQVLREVCERAQSSRGSVLATRREAESTIDPS